MAEGQKSWWLWALALLVLAVGGAVAYSVRGLRNNNPFNIKKGNDWLGEVPAGLATYQKDPVFEQFVSPHYGLRAGAYLLKKYNSTYSLKTVAAIIGRWSPPVENKTSEYVTIVAERMKIAPSTQLNLVANKERLADLMDAMIRVENGSNPYTRVQLLTAAEAA